MSNGDFTEISSARIQDTRDLVISKRNKGGYTIAQRILVEEGKKTTTMYLKGAIHIDSIDGIQNLRDALNLVIQQSECGAKEEAFNEKF